MPGVWTDALAAAPDLHPGLRGYARHRGDRNCSVTTRSATTQIYTMIDDDSVRNAMLAYRD